MYKQVALLGTAVDVVTMADTLNLIESFIRDGTFHQIATANTDFLVNSLRDEELRTVLSQCDLVVPDGMPLLWASRLMGIPMPERVTGADLVPKLGELSAVRGWRLFLLGGTPDASMRAESSMRERFPAVRIAGRLAPPPAPLLEMDNAAILDEIHRARPDILLVAFGNPKQEKWIHHHRKDLKVPVCIGVGAALDFIGGSVQRAPGWMQETGLEWLHRLITEPRRLGRRYFMDAIQFSRYLAMQLVANGFGSLRGEPFGIVRHHFAGKTVLQIKGRLSGAHLARFDEECRRVIAPGRAVIVDLAATSAIGADALATLMNLRRRAAQHTGQLILSGLTPRLQRTLRLSQASSQFYTVSEVLDALAGISSATAQITLEVGEESVICQLEGELSGSRAKAVLEVCDQLSRSFNDVRIDIVGLSESSRALFAGLPTSPHPKGRAA
jgi:N-acetylglucosaminyldiphosphoundecaprenol N-acetyl-beta-D-mannosaminyltransferase